MTKCHSEMTSAAHNHLMNASKIYIFNISMRIELITW